MAKISGYKVIATTSVSKEDTARLTGADAVVAYAEAPGTQYEDYKSVDIVARVKDITGGVGVKAVSLSAVSLRRVC